MRNCPARCGGENHHNKSLLRTLELKTNSNITLTADMWDPIGINLQCGFSIWLGVLVSIPGIIRTADLVRSTTRRPKDGAQGDGGEGCTDVTVYTHVNSIKHNRDTSLSKSLATVVIPGFIERWSRWWSPRWWEQDDEIRHLRKDYDRFEDLEEGATTNPNQASPQKHRFVTQVSYHVRAKLGIPKNTEANRMVARRIAVKFMQEKGHRPAHIARDISAILVQVFTPSKHDLYGQEMFNHRTAARARARYVHEASE